MSKKRIIILGAGPAGLAAGWKLSQAGQEVILLEKETSVGGICRTFRRNGFFFDLGGHRFITKDKQVSQEINKLMKGDLLNVQRKSIIRLKGKYFKYPLEFKNLFYNMNKFKLFISLLDYLYSRTIKKLFKKKDISFEDWVVNRFGRTLYKIYFGIYTEKLWGISSKKISADWAAQRISLICLWDVFLRLMGKKANRPKTYASEFAYPKMGIGMIAEKMADEINRNGGKIYLNSQVKKIITNEELVTKVIYEENDKEMEVSGDWYLSSILLTDFIKGIYPLVGQRYLDAANTIRFRSLRFLNLIIDSDKVSSNTWIYAPEIEDLFFRIQEPKNWSSLAAPSGKTSLILEIACNFGDDIWNAPDKLIYQRCVQDLNRLKLFDTAKIKDYFTTRIQYAYPIYEIGYKDQLEALLNFLKNIKHFISFGRQGLFRYNNMDHSIKMGFLAAKHIMHGDLETKIANIASEFEAFEIEDMGKGI